MEAKFGIEREKNNTLFYKKYQNDKGALHFHSQIELYFVDDGEMEVMVNGQRAILKKGELSVALSYDAHSYKTPEYSKSSVLIIPYHLCPEFSSLLHHKKAKNHFITEQSIVKEIKEHYEQIPYCADNNIKLLGHIYVILGIVLDYIALENTVEDIEPELISRILFYINENYKNDISLTSLSSLFGYSPSYISRYFRNSINIGLNRYISILRLKNAIKMMNEKKYSITYCALESGFNSVRTFYRVFYDEFKCSPKEYFSVIE